MRINLASVYVDHQERAPRFCTEVLGFKEALVGDRIPFTSFAVEDVAAQHARLRELGVRFTQEPTAVFDDTCGNLIQIAGQGAA